MLNLDLYIHGAGFIAPDKDFGGKGERLSAIEPDYAGVIPPMQLRRMSKAVRMGIGAAKACLDAAGSARPDAIAVGTTMGCLQDTEVFLKKMVVQEEQMLTPTAFIQSTHNTVAGQIALLTGCHGYNTTISQRGQSFEGAVMSAALYLDENPTHSVLCGGVDELNETSYALMRRAGMFAELCAGEGAGFLLLSRKAEGALLRMRSMLPISGFDDPNALLVRIRSAMQKEGGIVAGDELWLGHSEEGLSHQVYSQLLIGNAGRFHAFKENTGEWGTAIATAIAKLAGRWPEGRERVWLINHYCNDWSLWLLER